MVAHKKCVLLLAGIRQKYRKVVGPVCKFSRDSGPATAIHRDVTKVLGNEPRAASQGPR